MSNPVETNAIDDLRAEIEAATIESEDDLEAFRIQFLGRKQGAITELFSQIGSVPPEERPTFGQRVNQLKSMAEDKLEAAQARLEREQQQSAADIDLTLPGRRGFDGSIHPLTQTLDDIKHTFARFGFTAVEGPEIEEDWYLKQPDEAEQPVVLRTHTSPVQIRVMENTEPPVRVMVPGRVYRNEAISYKSFCLFHQVELLYVDEGVTMAQLKHVLQAFAEAMFGEDVRLRFRPSYFPFTEPSAEVDIWWEDPDDPDGGEWMEILGCGMVHPNVLDAVGYDTERYTGYAAGMGVERIAMLRHGIDDIRVFYENDIRFLDQF